MKYLLILLVILTAAFGITAELPEFHLVIDDDLYEAKSNAVGRALAPFWPVGTHAGVTNGMTPSEIGPIVNKGWQPRYCKASNTNEVYLWYGLTQIQIRNAASSGALATLKTQIEAAGISTNKFMVFRNKTIRWLDAYAISRGLKKNPALFTE